MQLQEIQSQITPKAKIKGPIANQGHIYSIIAKRYKKIVRELFRLAESKNESVKLGALKILINKILPDLKSVEFTGNGITNNITLIASGYVPQYGAFTTPSSTGDIRSTPVQGSDMAQTSKENDNSDKRVSETSIVAE